MKFGKLFGYIFEKLISEPEVGGLQITDASLQYVRIARDGVRPFSFRLPPGVLEEGAVKDAEQFRAALVGLHDLVQPKRREAPLKVVVALPASLVYTQSFRMPVIDDSRLPDSAALNLQMISPIEAAKAYMGWQKIGEAEDQLELLGAFVERRDTDALKILLLDAGFTPITFEFPALSLARVLGAEQGAGLFLLIDVSSDGVDFLIVKNGALYFDYFISWKRIQGSESAISVELFQAALLRELQRVMNFSSSRFKESLNSIFFIAPGLESQLEQTIVGALGIQPRPFAAGTYSLGATWHVALGSAIRARMERGRHEFISLGVGDAADAFFEERTLNFLRLWRNVTIGTFSIFLLAYAVVAAILVTQARGITAQLTAFRSTAQQRQLGVFEERAKEFNGLVAMVQKVRSSNRDWHAFLVRIDGLARLNNVTITSFDATGGGSFSMAGRAPSHTAVLALKNMLIVEPDFSDVDLPLSRIAIVSDNFVTFVLSFRF